MRAHSFIATGSSRIELHEKPAMRAATASKNRLPFSAEAARSPSVLPIDSTMA